MSSRWKVVKKALSESEPIKHKNVNAAPESVKGIDASKTGYVDTAETEEKVVTPPTGYVYELLGLDVNIAANSQASTGQHEFHLEQESPNMIYLMGTSGYGAALVYHCGAWETADKGQTPSNATAQVLVPRGIRASPSNGFVLHYENNTDHRTPQTRNYYLSVRKIQVD